MMNGECSAPSSAGSKRLQMEDQDNPQPQSITSYRFMMYCAACRHRRRVRFSEESGKIRAFAIGCEHSWMLSAEEELRLAKRQAKRGT
jgi:hypothetical protein